MAKPWDRLSDREYMQDIFGYTDDEVLGFGLHPNAVREMADDLFGTIEDIDSIVGEIKEKASALRAVLDKRA